ncbi:MAG: sigma-54-dependent Fis family transcriptional regulator, partial [Candidatus Omnitrophica bacterium]|nr:sigma-54-dependent Fis family transcriptional regulator [Candidatus Omnitrophota bacterium]
MQGSNKPVVMVVDDEDAVRYSFRRMMANEPFQVEAFSSGLEAVDRVRAGGISVVVLDVRLGGDMDGIQTLQAIKELEPKVSVILMTAYASANTAIEATRHGAFDYVLKPFESEEMRRLIQRAYQAHEAMATSIHFQETKSEEEPSESGDCIIGLSAPMQEVYKSIGRVANSSEPVLIRGESGAGKELVARALFQYSGRRDALFLPVNCGAIPEALLESEFFGHEKGSFTGAHERKIGKLEQADGGTVFLDEIGEMPLETQVKLLRFLEDRVVTRIGTAQGKKVDVRIIAATNRSLEEMVTEGAFREDLYYRLNVVTIEMPPLRRRKEDIPDLVKYFVNKHSRANGIKAPAILPETLRTLEEYEWPGNVRELENTIRRVLVQCRGHAITPDDLGLGDGPTSLHSETSEKGAEKSLAVHLENKLKKARADLQRTGNCAPVLPELELTLVEKALELTQGNQVQASKILGMSRNTLRKRVQSI